MAPLLLFCTRKVILLHIVMFLFASLFLYSSSEPFTTSSELLRRRTSAEPQLQKPTAVKNQTKLAKPANGSELTILSASKIKPKKINSSAISKKPDSTLKSTNSTKIASFSSKKTSDPLKLSTAKNKTSKQTSNEMGELVSESEKPDETQNQEKQKKEEKPKKQTKSQPSWVDQEDEGDLVSEFRDLPEKFQQTLLPDLEKVSTTSKTYMNKANKQITIGFKHIVGNKYASAIAPIVSFSFVLVPLVLVSFIFTRIKAYFSLQKLLIFIQLYLAIYFSILCSFSFLTSLEPLRFFYAASQPTYVCLQVMQTLGYLLYLLLLLMYLIVVSSTESGLGSKLLGLAQSFVGFSVGLHYYMAVFHRMVLHQPPKTSWKVHGLYATCFCVICICASAEKRKKAYPEGGEEGKNS